MSIYSTASKILWTFLFKSRGFNLPSLYLCRFLSKDFIWLNVPVRRVEQRFDLKMLILTFSLQGLYIFFAGYVSVAAWHIHLCTPTFSTSEFIFSFFYELVLALRQLLLSCDWCCADNGAAIFAAADAAANTATDAKDDGEEEASTSFTGG